VSFRAWLTGLTAGRFCSVIPFILRLRRRAAYRSRHVMSEAL
jgi:hypothetical protein